MKYILTATFLTYGFGGGCADKKAPSEQNVATESTTATAQTNDVAVAQDEQVIHFTGPQDLKP